MNETLTWQDGLRIAEELFENHPAINPLQISFPDLYQKIINLPLFSDDKNSSNERILEYIQAEWISLFEEDN